METHEEKRKSQEEKKEMNEPKQDPREALLNTIAALIRVNYKILELLDQRLTTLEDECSKKKGIEAVS